MPSRFETFVRLRPLSSTEQCALERELIITQNEQSHTLSLSTATDAGKPRTWRSGANVSHTFASKATNRHVYDRIVKPALGQVMDGATCNFFAYGHSGSGKTHTVIGYDYDDNEQLGLCLSTARDLFQAIGVHREEEDHEVLGVAARLYEVRGKSARDLFNNGIECHIRQGPDGQTHVRGQTEVLANGKVRVRPIVAKPFWALDELRQAILAGLQLRKVGSSSVHDESSRTHAIIELEIVDKKLLEARDAVIERESDLVPIGKRATDVYIEEQMKSLRRTDDGQYVQNPEHPLDQNKIDAAEAKKREYELRLAQAEEAVKKCFQGSKRRCLGGKFVFVDLAGSEYFDQANGSSSGGLSQTPQERQQGRQINTDLFALKEVIRARASGQARIPYRSSPLTMVLRSHFEGGHGGTSSIMLTVSPAETHWAATKNTLSYGSLVTCI